MEQDAISVHLQRGRGDDDTELAELTGLLQAELLELDVRSVEPQAVRGPDGAKGIGTVIGALTVSLGAAERLATLLRTIGDWTRRNNRTVEIKLDGHELKLTNVSVQQQNRIIDSWLAQHVPNS